MDPHADPLKGIDMTQLHRCIQMHACLQKLPSLQARTLCSSTQSRLCQRQSCLVKQRNPRGASAHICVVERVQPIGGETGVTCCLHRATTR